MSPLTYYLLGVDSAIYGFVIGALIIKGMAKMAARRNRKAST